MHLTDLQRAHETIRAEATRLAGGLKDVAQRATVYHHLYRDSGGNHIFPLIAAHGALWARGYFRFGMWLGRCAGVQYCFNSVRRREQGVALEAFADAFRDINRRVCVDSYTNYHFVKRFGTHAEADQLLPAPTLAALLRLHEARQQGRTLSDAERLEVFKAHFLHEQEHEVGPSVAQATRVFAWPVMQWLALQPIVRFAYFPGWRVLRFRDFSDQQERINHGLQAFAWGAEAGWDTVEQRLSAYRILPAEFFAESTEYFLSLRETLLSAA